MKFYAELMFMYLLTYFLVVMWQENINIFEFTLGGKWAITIVYVLLPIICAGGAKKDEQ